MSIYRATPISQRDGSALANSNCRMASAATGLDFDTTGAKTSTGSKMRSYTTDRIGGTDSSDAKQAWQKGYSETLTVRDGGVWSDAQRDLLAGRLVHLDVWHVTAGGCVSGTGKYGHTVAVAPERNGSRWLVADPWCLPAKWQWIEESRLRAGAEEWGRRVRAGTGGQHEYPNRAFWVLALATTARALMGRYHAGGSFDDTPDPVDTGGPAVIMYTTTDAHPDTSGGETDVARFINVNGYATDSGKRINVGAGADWFYFDGAKGGDIRDASTLTCHGLLDSERDRYVVTILSGVPYADKIARETMVMIKTTNKPFDAPDPAPVPGPDCAEAIAMALSERDAEWEDWLLGGAPNQQQEVT